MQKNGRRDTRKKKQRSADDIARPIYRPITPEYPTPSPPLLTLVGPGPPHLGLGQPLGQADHEHQVALDYAHAGQVLPVLCELLPLLALPLLLLALDLLQLLGGEGLVDGGVLRVGLEGGGGGGGDRTMQLRRTDEGTTKGVRGEGRERGGREE